MRRNVVSRKGSMARAMRWRMAGYGEMAEENPWEKKRSMRGMRLEKKATVSISEGVGSMVRSKLVGAGDISK